MRIHIVSHSHWDREWYESFTSHRMKLVELMDDLLELFETDANFQSFHLDGQWVLLEDYLAIKPYNKEKLKKLVLEKKLIVGPFYVLQDELLITSEENARNSLIGYGAKEEWGELCPVGYFPDTFGHVDQLAQICELSGLKYVFFGRGVKPVGFDNQIQENGVFSSKFSEMYLESPNKSRVLGILFANWYSNGNEIPSEKTRAKMFWDQKISDARRFAASDSILLMNGCDHQPVQKDLSKALEMARELYPDITFIHSSLEAYAKEVEQNIQKTKRELEVVKGELTGQETDGWYTLANTASSRIYLKEENTALSDILTMVAEPLSLTVQEIRPYPKELLQYAWKELMKNLAHDSICGCSIDAVHREMMTRYETVRSTVQYIIDEGLAAYADGVDTSCAIGAKQAFLIYNPSPNANAYFIDELHPVEKYYFKDSDLRPDLLYQMLQQEAAKEYILVDKEGKSVPAIVEYVDCHFGYELPKDAFRKPYIARRYRIRLYQRLEAMTEVVYFFVLKDEDTTMTKPTDARNDATTNTTTDATKGETTEKTKYARNDSDACGCCFENPFYKLEICDNRVKYWDKRNATFSENILRIEDIGDIGNEYIFKAPVDDVPIYANLVQAHCVDKTDAMQEWHVCFEMMIPESADERLQEEEKSLVEFRNRRAKRSSILQNLHIETRWTMYQERSAFAVKLSFHNQQKNHRLRLVMDSMRECREHFADSSFSIVTRQNQVSSTWENPSNPQHMLKLVGMGDERGGMMLSSSGLNEYEILENRYIALTLLRATGELGDWGYFPTKDSQEIGEIQRTVLVDTYRCEELQQTWKYRLMTGIAPLTKVLPIRKKLCKVENAVLPQSDAVFYTAYKQKEQGTKSLIRYVNLSKEQTTFSVSPSPSYLNLLEQGMICKGAMQPMEVRTEVVSKEDIMDNEE